MTEKKYSRVVVIFAFIFGIVIMAFLSSLNPVKIDVPVGYSPSSPAYNEVCAYISENISIQGCSAVQRFYDEQKHMEEQIELTSECIDELEWAYSNEKRLCSELEERAWRTNTYSPKFAYNEGYCDWV